MDNDHNERLNATAEETSGESTSSNSTNTKTDISCDSSISQTPGTQLQDSTVTLTSVVAQPQTEPIYVPPFAAQHPNPPVQPFSTKTQTSTTSLSNFRDQSPDSEKFQSTFAAQPRPTTQPQTALTAPPQTALAAQSRLGFLARPLNSALPNFVVFDPVTNDVSESTFAQNDEQYFPGRFMISSNSDGTLTAYSINADGTIHPRLPIPPNHSQNDNLSRDENEKDYVNEASKENVICTAALCDKCTALLCDKCTATTTMGSTSTEPNNTSEQGRSLELSAYDTIAAGTRAEAVNITSLTPESQASNPMPIHPPSPMIVDYQFLNLNTAPVPPPNLSHSSNPEGPWYPIYPSYNPTEQRPVYSLQFQAFLPILHHGTSYFYNLPLSHPFSVATSVPHFRNENTPLFPVDQQQSCVSVFRTNIQHQVTQAFVEQQYYNQHQGISSSVLEGQTSSQVSPLNQHQAVEIYVEDQASSPQNSSLHQHPATESIVLEEQASSSQDSSLHQQQPTESTIFEEQASSSQDCSLYQHQTENTVLHKQALSSQDTSFNQHQAIESSVLEEQASPPQALYQHRTESVVLAEQASSSQNSSLHQSQSTKSAILEEQVSPSQVSSLHQHEATESTVLEERDSSQDSLYQHQATESNILEEQASSPQDQALESTVLDKQTSSSQDSSFLQPRSTESTVLEEQASSSHDARFRKFFPKQSGLLKSIRNHALGNAYFAKYIERENRPDDLSSTVTLDAYDSESNSPGVSPATNLDDIGCTEISPMALNTTIDERQAAVDSEASLETSNQHQMSNLSSEKEETSFATEFPKTCTMEERALNEETSKERENSHPAENKWDIIAEFCRKRARQLEELSANSDLNELANFRVRKIVTTSSSDVSTDNTTSASASCAINLGYRSKITTEISVEKESDAKNSPNILNNSSKSAEQQVPGSEISFHIQVGLNKNEVINKSKTAVFENKVADVVQAGSRDAGRVQAGSRDAGRVQAGSRDAGSVQAGSRDAGSVHAGSRDAGNVQDWYRAAGIKTAGAATARIKQFGSKALEAAQAENMNLNKLKHALIAKKLVQRFPIVKIGRPNILRYEPEAQNDLDEQTEAALRGQLRGATHCPPSKPIQPRPENKTNTMSKEKSPGESRMDKKRNKLRTSRQTEYNTSVDTNMGAAVSSLPAGQNLAKKPGKDCKVILIRPQSKKGMERIMFADNATALRARVDRTRAGTVTGVKLGEPTQILPDAVRATLSKNQVGIHRFFEEGDPDKQELEKTMHLLKDTEEDEPKEKELDHEESASAASSSKKKRGKNKK